MVFAIGHRCKHHETRRSLVGPSRDEFHLFSLRGAELVRKLRQTRWRTTKGRWDARLRASPRPRWLRWLRLWRRKRVEERRVLFQTSWGASSLRLQGQKWEPGRTAQKGSCGVPAYVQGSGIYGQCHRTDEPATVAKSVATGHAPHTSKYASQTH